MIPLPVSCTTCCPLPADLQSGCSVHPVQRFTVRECKASCFFRAYLLGAHVTGLGGAGSLTRWDDMQQASRRQQPGLPCLLEPLGQAVNARGSGAGARRARA